MNSKEETLLRLLSRLRPRIWPQEIRNIIEMVLQEDSLSESQGIEIELSEDTFPESQGNRTVRKLDSANQRIE